VAGSGRSAAVTAAMAVLAHPVLVSGAVLLAAFGPLVGGSTGLLPALAWTGVGVVGTLARRPGLPGIEVPPAAEPEVAELVRRVGGAVGFTEPVVVRVVPEPTASLARPRVGGARTYVLVLGWPYLRLLARAELEAVVAHELAHRVELAQPAFRALSRSRERLADGLDRQIRVPAALAGRLLRATQARMWTLELAADRTSAGVAGPTAARGALTRTATLGALFERLVAGWLDVAAAQGRFPADLYEAVADALADPPVERRARLLVAEEEAVDPYAAADHPPLRARLAALPMVPPDPYDQEPVAIRDPVALEDWCVRDLLDQVGAAPGDGLEPFALREAEPQSFSAPVWEACSALRLATGQRTTDAAVAVALDAVEDGGWAALAGSVEPAVRRLPRLLRPAAARDVLAGCLGVAVAGRLLDRGWRRGSRWLTCIVRSPAGEVLDLQEMVRTAVDAGAAGPLRDLFAAPTATH
jgi:Zn-dependent protease with chaperone function